MTTMRDVAKRAGVSAKTVSRVSRGDDYVSADARERVLAAMAELNYLPNATASAFRRGAAPLWAVAVPNLADPFFAEVIHAIDTVARAHHFVLAVTSLGDDPTAEREVVEALLAHHVAGLIIAPTGADQGYLARWSEQVPIVFIDREPQGVDADLFIEDDRGGARTAVAHLIEHGHRGILFVGDSDAVTTSHRRWEGYRDALATASPPIAEEHTEWADAAAARDRVEDVLSAHPEITAIFCSNSRTAAEIAPLLWQGGHSTHALVSFGDFAMATSLAPAISAIDQQPARLGHLAAERLRARIGDPAASLKRRTVLDVPLIARESTTHRLG